MPTVFNINNLKIVLGVIRDRGFLSVLRYIYHDYMFDTKYGTDTINIVTIEDMHVNSENKQHGTIYQGVPVLMFDELLSELNIDFQRSTFIDYGSGKGKALMLASKFGFGNIIGVEYSSELVETCKKNIAHYCRKIKTAVNFTVICSDAAEFDVPADANCLFFYNPFDEPVIRKVLARVEGSIDKYPRDIWILYVNPRLSTFKNHPYIELVKENREWHIYRLHNKGEKNK